MKLASQIFLVSIVSLGLGASALAQIPFKSTDVEGYTFRHITDRVGTDRLPRVSTNGYVTWEGFTGGPLQIFLSNVAEGSTTEQVTNDQMVNSVYVRHNGVVTQVTNDPFDSRREERYPDINDNGIVVWASRTLSDPGRFWLDSYDINTGVLTNTDIRAYRPHISNDNVLESAAFNILFRLPSQEDVDFPTARAAEYRLYRRGEINHLNQVAIEAEPEGPGNANLQGPRDILFWDGSELKLVYSSDVFVGRADLNDSGIIAFEGLGGLPGSQSTPDDFEIFVYNANTEELVQLTDDTFNDQWPTVLEDGSIVWNGTGNYPTSTNSTRLDSDIFIATPISAPTKGDINQDGVVDFRDISPFISILSDGGFLDQADINADEAVDFRDIVPFIALLSA